MRVCLLLLTSHITQLTMNGPRSRASQVQPNAWASLAVVSKRGSGIVCFVDPKPFRRTLEKVEQVRNATVSFDLHRAVNIPEALSIL